MAIYLKKFETQAAYEASESGLILPNVSLTLDNNTVHYNPSTPPTPSYEYVDLGLPSGTLWARYNVGANSETDYGNYYQYGGGAKEYEEGDSFYETREDPLAASADTATQVWGGSWHMPTSTQCQELIDNTTYEWTTINGVIGGKFTAQNGNYIFIPAAGFKYWHGSGYSDVGEYGNVLTSTPEDDDSSRYIYIFTVGEYEPGCMTDEGYVCSVRPVIG